jgi:hypothetical protein
VTHLDVDDDGIERTLAAVREFCAQGSTVAAAPAAAAGPY